MYIYPSLKFFDKVTAQLDVTHQIHTLIDDLIISAL